MQILPLKNNPYYNLQFKFVYNADLVARCNKLSKALSWKKFRYDGNLKAWLFSLENLTTVLKEFPGTDTPEEVLNEFIEQDLKQLSEDLSKDEVKYTPIEIDLPLYEYQKVGVNFIVHNEKCAVFDECRLGKLYQSVGAIHYLKPLMVLVICPARTKTNWQRKTMEIINRESILTDDRFERGMNIISYDSLQKFAMEVEVKKKGKLVKEWKWMDDTEWDMVIVDESHKTKGGKTTIRGTLTEQVCQKAKRVVLLSATPIPTHTKDLMPQLRMIDKIKEFGSEWDFMKRYCGLKKLRFGWWYNGSTNTKELHDKLQKFTIKRTFAEVFPDLPQQREDVTYVDLPNWTEYYAVQKKLNQEINEASEYYREVYKKLAGKNKIERAEVLVKLKEDKYYKSLTSLVIVKLGKLRREIIRQKLELLPEILEEYTSKTVVFTIHKEPARKLQSIYAECSIFINSDTPAKESQNYIDRFQQDSKLRYAFVTIDTCNEGLDFSAANHVIHTELDWTPDKHKQASSRVLNTEKIIPTTANFLVANNTVDEDIAAVLVNKSKNIEEVIGGNLFSNILNRISDLPF